MRRGNSKDWSMKVTCPLCVEKFVISQGDIYLEKDKKNPSKLVPVVDCNGCERPIAIKNVPPNILVMIEGAV